MPPRFGAHMSIAGGLPLAIDRAVVHRCEALQIFTKNASQWHGRRLPADEIRDFRRRTDAAGIKPVDSKGRGLVVDYNVPVECGGVMVSPGDLVFADYDGVIVIPAAAVPEAVTMATDKVTRENHTRGELMNGALLRDVYAKYGVL